MPSTNMADMTPDRGSDIIIPSFARSLNQNQPNPKTFIPLQVFHRQPALFIFLPFCGGTTSLLCLLSVSVYLRRT